jgi:hypothetical protein
MAANNELSKLLELVEREGINKTYRALVRVLDNDKSPPTALASASSSMVKLFTELSAKLEDGDLDPSQMTLEQIVERTEELQRERLATSNSGVFD